MANSPVSRPSGGGHGSARPDPIPDAQSVLRRLSAEALEQLAQRVRAETTLLVQAGEPPEQANRVTLAALRVFPREQSAVRVCTAIMARWAGIVLNRVRAWVRHGHNPLAQRLPRGGALDEVSAADAQALGRLSAAEFEGLLAREQNRQFFLQEMQEWVDRALDPNDREDREEIARSLSWFASSPTFPDNVVAFRIQSPYLREFPPALARLEALEELTIAGCEAAGDLPPAWGALRSLKTLCLMDCPLIGGGSIPIPGLGNLASLEQLIILRCRNLRVLPDNLGELRNLRVLGLSGSGVSSLPESIGGCERLEQLFIQGSRAVVLPESLGHLRNLRRIDLAGSEVVRLPATMFALPASCEISMLRGTRGVMQAVRVQTSLPEYTGPQFPGAREIDAFERVGNGPVLELEPVLRVSRAGVQQNPLEALHKVQALIARRENLSVHFDGEMGVDAGGLRRELWTLLGHALLDTGGDNRLPVERHGSEKFPSAKDEVQGQDWRAYGEVLAWGIDHGLYFPSTWDENWFKAFRAALAGDTDCRIALLMTGNEEELDALEPPGGRPRTSAEWARLCELYPYVVEGVDEADWAQLGKEEQKKRLLQGGIEAIKAQRIQERMAWIRAMRSIAAGIDAYAGAPLDAVRDLSPQELAQGFFGRLSRADVANRLRCNNPDQPELAWLKNWVIGASDAQLKAFLRTLTGSEVLTDQTSLSLVMGPPADAIHIHTCSGSIDVPRGMDEPLFLQALGAALMESHRERFDLA